MEFQRGFPPDPDLPNSQYQAFKRLMLTRQNVDKMGVVDLIVSFWSRVILGR
jgi:hypothetical protein